MRLSLFFLIFITASKINAQNRVNKIYVNIPNIFYTYGEGTGHLNNVVRYNEGLSFTFKTYDTAKKKGMIYELLTNNTIGYYKNALGADSILEVDDLHANLLFIFPMYIFYNKRITHTIGIGLGIGTILGRDYYSQNNTLLAYNDTNLKEIKFGKSWTSSILLEYEADIKFAKRWGYSAGIRLTTAAPVSKSSKGTYSVAQGNSLSLKYGVFYLF